MTLTKASLEQSLWVWRGSDKETEEPTKGLDARMERRQIESQGLDKMEMR